MGNAGSGRAAAASYVNNAHNRGVFDRPNDLASRTDVDPIDFLLSEEFVRRARLDLAPLVQAWTEHLPHLPKRILDAGCGPGATTLALAECYPGASVHGIDVERPALALAEHLAAHSPTCTFSCTPLETFESPVGFDLIHCRAVIEHVFDPARAMGRIVSMLNSGGVAYVETPNYWYPWEPHLKMPILPKSPKAIVQAQCRLTGRDPQFVDHLNFTCDRRRLRKWALASDPRVHVVDLAAAKIEAIFRGEQTPVVVSRARLIRAVRRIGPMASLARRTFIYLPVAPSVIMLIVKPSRSG